MKSVAKVKLVLERPNKAGTERPIYVRVTLNRRKKDFRTGQCIPNDLRFWDEEESTVKLRKHWEQGKKIKALAERKRNQIKEVITELELRGKVLTFDAIKKALASGLDQTFIAYAQERFKVELDAGYFKESTYHAYLARLVRINKFAPAAKLTDIDEIWIERFYKWMRDRGMSQNTIVNTQRVLSKILNYAEDQRHIPHNPIKKVRRLSWEKVEKEFLTIEELELLDRLYHSKELLNRDYGNRKRASYGENLQATLQMFLVGCYTGLRWSDIKSLRGTDLVGGMVKRKTIKRSKWVRIPYNGKLKGVLNVEAYEGWKGLVFPKVPKGNYHNLRLAEIMKIVGINRHITFHASRHTFATTAITLGIDIATVAEFLGHSDLRETKIYAKLVDDKLEHEMSKFDALGSNEPQKEKRPVRTLRKVS